MANQAVTDDRTLRRITDPTAHGTAFGQWMHLLRARLRDRRFWLVQLMVVAVTGGHASTEFLPMTEGSHFDAIYFVPASLYLFPILYASLNFGREGAIPTAVWSALLAVPNILLWHSGLERLGEAFQMMMMIMLACIVAWRVDKEVAARRRAEAMERGRALSEVKYRALFDGAAEPILVMDENWVIQEANAAAAALLSTATAALRGSRTVDALGSAAADILAMASPSSQERNDVRLRRADGTDIWLEPIVTVVAGAEGEALVQVMLKDVTERRGFQHYAREITRAQEEERQRIAQELHDVSVQSAIMICRRLDAAAEAIEDGRTDEIARRLAEARHTAETMADELRRFSRDLRPLILDDLGLVPALKRLLLELRERSGMVVHFDVNGPVQRLDPAVELAMFRIGQEALRNIEVHAAASHAAVEITFRAGDVVTLKITDDGSGFLVPSLATLIAERRLGLLGMRERAELVGGGCEILSSPGTGTSVVTVAPAAAPAPG